MNRDQLDPPLLGLFDDATHYGALAVNCIPASIARNHFFVARVLWPPVVIQGDVDEDGYGRLEP